MKYIIKSAVEYTVYGGYRQKQPKSLQDRVFK